MNKVKITREFNSADGKGFYIVETVPHVSGMLRSYCFNQDTKHPDIDGEETARKRAFEYAKKLEKGEKTEEVIYTTPDLSTETIETINPN